MITLIDPANRIRTFATINRAAKAMNLTVAEVEAFLNGDTTINRYWTVAQFKSL